MRIRRRRKRCNQHVVVHRPHDGCCHVDCNGHGGAVKSLLRKHDPHPRGGVPELCEDLLHGHVGGGCLQKKASTARRVLCPRVHRDLHPEWQCLVLERWLRRELEGEHGGCWREVGLRRRIEGDLREGLGLFFFLQSVTFCIFFAECFLQFVARNKALAPLFFCRVSLFAELSQATQHQKIRKVP